MDVRRVILPVLLVLCQSCGALSLHHLHLNLSLNPTAAIPFEWVRTEGYAGYKETGDCSY